MAGEPVDAIDVTAEFEVEDAPTEPRLEALERETDPRRISQRQRQIDMGKNTIGYQRYIQQVPMDLRTKEHPMTPDVHQHCSKRGFDGQVRKWRRALHQWDLPEDRTEVVHVKQEEQEENEDQDVVDFDSPMTAAKNAKGHRRKGGLPLKMPSAIRPAAGKRGRNTQPSFLQALLSPTTAAPAGKVAKTQVPDDDAKIPQHGNHHQERANDKEERVKIGQSIGIESDIVYGAGLMAKWADMAVDGETAHSRGAHVERSYLEEEVCYSDEEMEPMREIMV